MLARMNNSTSIVECGTSFGLSTIYLALAVAQNAQSPSMKADGVLTMEKDSGKMARARETWAQAGTSVAEWIHPREGDLLEILADETNLPDTVDLLFLDGQVTHKLKSSADVFELTVTYSLDVHSSASIKIGPRTASAWIYSHS